VRTASPANRSRYSAGQERDTHDDQPTMTSSDYRDHASDSHQKAERDPNHGVCLDRMDDSNRELGEHAEIVPSPRPKAVPL
jgi:hypothetical protein